jgi:hypothetical protein
MTESGRALREILQGISRIILVLWLWGMAPCDLPAWQPNDAGQSARRALAERGAYPWYDAAGDGLAPRRLSVEPAPKGPDRWAHGRSWQWPRMRSWGSFWEFIKYMVWLLLACFLAWLVYLFARVYWRREQQEADRMRDRMQQLRGDAQRIERLPYDLATETLDLRALAEQSYRQGHFDRAIVYLFSYLLVELDRAHLIRLARGKTNRQYLAELRRQADLKAIVEPAMVAFEDVFFGRRRLGRESFERCWSMLPAFGRLVQPEQTGTTP